MTNLETRLKEVIDVAIEKGDAQSLLIASILVTICACLNDSQGHDNIKKISEFTCSVSRESLIRINRDLDSKD